MSPRVGSWKHTALLGLFLALPAQADSISDCADQIANQPQFAIMSGIFNSLLDVKQTCVHNSPRTCDGAQLDTRWHYRAVDADLMLAAMDEWRKEGSSRGPQPVAVVDSMFGPRISDVLHGNPKVDRTYLLADPDKSAHGAITPQFITGEPGLGVAPKNPIFLYDAGANEGAVNTENGYRAALKACKAGQRVINISFNRPKTTTGPEQLRDFVNTLADLGCVVVKAAGNDGVQDGDDLEAYKQDFGTYLAVGSTRRTGGVSMFSDSGAVYAPGENLAVNMPSDSILSTCGRVPEIMQSGTSFAAPITSGITAQVVEVLDSSPAFRRLAPRAQAGLIMKTVRESADSPTGNISGFKAVRGAIKWVKQAQNMYEEPECPALPKDCTMVPATTDCKADGACSAAVRTILSTCPDSLAKQPVDFFMRVQLVDPWLALRTLDALRGKNAGWTSLVGRLYNQDYWLREIKKQVSPFKDLPNLLDVYSRTRLPTLSEPGQPEAKIAYLLTRAASENIVVARLAQKYWDHPMVGPSMMRAVRMNMLPPSGSARGEQAMNIVRSMYGRGARNPAMDKFAIDFMADYRDNPMLFPIYLDAFVNQTRPSGEVSKVLEAAMPSVGRLPAAAKDKTKELLGTLAQRKLITMEEYRRFMSSF